MLVFNMMKPLLRLEADKLINLCKLPSLQGYKFQPNNQTRAKLYHFKSDWRVRLLAENGGGGGAGFSNTSPNTRALSYPCTKTCQREKEIKGLPRKNWQWGEIILAWSPLGEADWRLLGGTKWMLGQDTGEVPLSSTDSLIKDLEDDNRLDMGLCTASPSHSSSREGWATVWVKAYLNNSLHHHWVCS